MTQSWLSFSIHHRQYHNHNKSVCLYSEWVGGWTEDHACLCSYGKCFYADLLFVPTSLPAKGHQEMVHILYKVPCAKVINKMLCHSLFRFSSEHSISEHVKTINKKYSLSDNQRIIPIYFFAFFHRRQQWRRSRFGRRINCFTVCVWMFRRTQITDYIWIIFFIFWF